MTEPEHIRGHLIGYRSWHGVNGLLEATNIVGPLGLWLPGRNVAKCAHNTSHDGPVEGCTCGLHASYRPSLPEPETVCGVVILGGRIALQANTMRGQYAQVVALDRSSAGWIDSGGETLTKLAAHYKVPTLKREELATYASEYGREVLARELPEPPPNSASAFSFTIPAGVIPAGSAVQVQAWGGGGGGGTASGGGSGGAGYRWQSLLSGSAAGYAVTEVGKRKRRRWSLSRILFGMTWAAFADVLVSSVLHPDELAFASLGVVTGSLIFQIWTKAWRQ